MVGTRGPAKAGRIDRADNSIADLECNGTAALADDAHSYTYTTAVVCPSSHARLNPRTNPRSLMVRSSSGLGVGCPESIAAAFANARSASALC